jgi:hypothetical protein
MKFRKLIFLFLFPVFILCCIDLKPPVVSMEKYQRIQAGMSYSEVVNIIGTQGTEMSRNDMPGIQGVMKGITTVMFMWQNSDGTNMNAMFHNDKLISKAQFGLR